MRTDVNCQCFASREQRGHGKFFGNDVEGIRKHCVKNGKGFDQALVRSIRFALRDDAVSRQTGRSAPRIATSNGLYHSMIASCRERYSSFLDIIHT